MKTQGYVSSNGLKLYYETEGVGKPMVLLNGGPGFSHEYMKGLRALSTDALLVYFDQRGTGKSDKAPAQTYTVDANVEDLEQLRQQLGLDSFILLGHSWGGMLAQAYVLKYPAHVSKLVLANTFSCTQDINAALQRMLAAVPDEIRQVYALYEAQGLYQDGDHYPAEYQAALDIAYEPVSLSVPAPDYLADMFSKIAYDVYRVMWGEETEFKVTGTLAGFDSRPRLHEIQVPTLVTVGASDMPTVEMAQALAQAIPGARLEVFEHSRHFPFIEEPDKFLRVLREFIGGEG